MAETTTDPQTGTRRWRRIVGGWARKTEAVPTEAAKLREAGEKFLRRAKWAAAGEAAACAISVVWAAAANFGPEEYGYIAANLLTLLTIPFAAALAAAAVAFLSALAAWADWSGAVAAATRQTTGWKVKAGGIGLTLWWFLPIFGPLGAAWTMRKIARQAAGGGEETACEAGRKLGRKAVTWALVFGWGLPALLLAFQQAGIEDPYMVAIGTIWLGASYFLAKPVVAGISGGLAEQLQKPRQKKPRTAPRTRTNRKRRRGR